MLLHTGLKSYPLFTYIFNLDKPKVLHVQYYKGEKRLLKPENELLVVLMKLMHLFPGICGAFDFSEKFLVKIPTMGPQNLVKSDQISPT